MKPTFDGSKCDPRKYTTPTWGIPVELTPELAKFLIRFRNEKNRPRIKKNFDKIVRSIRAGKYLQTSDHIAFDRDARLINGHHRIEGVIVTGLTIDVVIDFGLDPSTINNIDRNALRSGGQIFYMNGAKNAASLAAICTAIWVYENRTAPFDRNVTVSAEEAFAIYLEQPAYFDDLTTKAKQVCRTSGGTPKVVGCMWHECAKIDKEMAERFFESFGSDIGQVEGSPILALRRRLLVRSERFSIHSLEEAALIILAFNAFRSGTLVKSIRWNPDQGFPTLNS